MELSLNFNHHQLFGFGNACLGDKLNVAKIRTKLGKIANALYF